MAVGVAAVAVAAVVAVVPVVAVVAAVPVAAAVVALVMGCFVVRPGGDGWLEVRCQPVRAEFFCARARRIPEGL